MKKLFSFITAGALLLGSLGLSSCSGDLHDNATQPLFIIGSAAATGWGSWDKCTLEEPDGSVQKYEFIASEGAPAFKLSTAGSWATDIAGDDVKEALPVLNGDYVTLHSREAEGLPNTQNVIINDCTVGEKYTINIKFNAITLEASVQVKGSATVMPELTLASTTPMKNFPAGETYTFTRSGTDYTYEFISNADETVSFFIESSTAGLKYGGADLSVAKAPLTVYDDTEMVAVVKKNNKYKLTVKVPTLTTATITAEEVSMLEKASISANWKYTDNFYEVDAKSGAVKFIADNTDFEFTVNRVSGDNKLAWGTGTLAVDGDAKELTYNADGKAKPIKVTGLQKGKCYQIILTENRANFVLSAKVINMPLSDLSTADAIGDFNGNGISLGSADSEGNYSVEIAYSNAMNAWGGGNGTVNFKLRKVAGDWGKGEFNSNDVFEYKLADGLSNSGSGNITISGLKDGTTYVFKFIPDFGGIKIEVIEK
ncbi:MAG: hypothetical protein K6E78_06915 [Treponema sp.]|nr:hypothetical protein [Treponema sp.]